MYHKITNFLPFQSVPNFTVPSMQVRSSDERAALSMLKPAIACPFVSRSSKMKKTEQRKSPGFSATVTPQQTAATNGRLRIADTSEFRWGLGVAALGPHLFALSVTIRSTTSGCS